MDRLIDQEARSCCGFLFFMDFWREIWTFAREYGLLQGYMDFWREIWTFRVRYGLLENLAASCSSFKLAS